MEVRKTSSVVKVLVAVAFSSVFLTGVSADSDRVVTGFEHDYSALITDENSSEQVYFRVSNPSSQQKELESTVSGAGSTFVNTGSTSTGSYILGPGEERKFLISVEPDSPGSKELRVSTLNLDTNLNTTASIRVEVSEYEVISNTETVPGAGFLQLLMLLLVSSYLYSARL